ncbi:MAG: N-6 DNA methylase, partial [bacterium]|nr:N-6 DNA methylase [bacterium]
MKNPYKEWFGLLIDICNKLYKYNRFKNRSMDHLYKTGLRFVLFHAFRLHSNTNTDEFHGLFISKEDLSFLPQFENTVGSRTPLSCHDPHFPEDLYSEAIKFELKPGEDGIIGFTRIKSRRNSGVYYTPKIVVDHMIKETLKPLIRGLPAEQFLNIKICDPAMGTGKFLFAAADYLKREYDKLTGDSGRNQGKNIYASIVKNCIFGIDNDPIAYALTISCFIIKVGIAANELPNFLLGDTLLDDLPEDLKFDAVIGNPPWMTYGIRDVKKIDPDLNKILRKKYSATAEYKISVYSLFMDKALDLTKSGGYHSFIVPDSWLTGRYFYKLRKFFLRNTSILRLVLFSKDFWEGLSVGRCMIYLVRKEESNNAGRKINCAVLKDPEELKHVRKKNVRISGSRIRKRERSRIFLFGNEREKRIVEQMEDCGGRLGDHIRFYSGLIGRKG